MNIRILCPGGGMVDASDLKSDFRKEVSVRARPRAPQRIDLAPGKVGPGISQKGLPPPVSGHSRPGINVARIAPRLMVLLG